MVRVGRLHFCVKNAAVTWYVSHSLAVWGCGWLLSNISARGCVRASDSRLFVLLEIVVDEAHNERRLEDG